MGPEGKVTCRNGNCRRFDSSGTEWEKQNDYYMPVKCSHSQGSGCDKKCATCNGTGKVVPEDGILCDPLRELCKDSKFQQDLLKFLKACQSVNNDESTVDKCKEVMNGWQIQHEIPFKNIYQLLTEGCKTAITLACDTATKKIVQNAELKKKFKMPNLKKKPRCPDCKRTHEEDAMASFFWLHEPV